MEFYGDLDRKMTKEEALEYYEKKGFSGVKKYKDEALKIYKSSPNLRRSRNSKGNQNSCIKSGKYYSQQRMPRFQR